SQAQRTPLTPKNGRTDNKATLGAVDFTLPSLLDPSQLIDSPPQQGSVPGTPPYKGTEKENDPAHRTDRGSPGTPGEGELLKVAVKRQTTARHEECTGKALDIKRVRSLFREAKEQGLKEVRGALDGYKERIAKIEFQKKLLCSQALHQDVGNMAHCSMMLDISFACFSCRT
ncbi:hypothetical protein CYMTET_22609, partial [Cymbomonas tetramitiformis]